MNTIQGHITFSKKNTPTLARFASTNPEDRPYRIPIPRNDKIKKITRDPLTGTVTVKTFAQTIEVPRKNIKNKQDGTLWFPLGKQEIIIKIKDIDPTTPLDNKKKQDDIVKINLPPQTLVFADSPNNNSQSQSASYTNFIHLLEIMVKSEKWKAEKIYLVTRSQFIDQLLKKHRTDPIQVIRIKNASLDSSQNTFYLDDKDDDLNKTHHSRIRMINNNIPPEAETYAFAVKVSPKSLVLVSPVRNDHSTFEKKAHEDQLFKLLNQLTKEKDKTAGLSDDLNSWFQEKKFKTTDENICVQDIFNSDLSQFAPGKNYLIRNMLHNPDAVIDAILELETLSPPERHIFSKIAGQLLSQYKLTHEQLEENPPKQADSIKEPSRQFWQQLCNTLQKLHEEDKIHPKINIDNYLTKLLKFQLQQASLKAKTATP